MVEEMCRPDRERHWRNQQEHIDEHCSGDPEELNCSCGHVNVIPDDYADNETYDFDRWWPCCGYAHVFRCTKCGADFGIVSKRVYNEFREYVNAHTPTASELPLVYRPFTTTYREIPIILSDELQEDDSKKRLFDDRT